MNINHTNPIAEEILGTNCIQYLNSVATDLLPLLQYEMITEYEYDLLVNLALQQTKKLKKAV